MSTVIGRTAVTSTVIDDRSEMVLSRSHVEKLSSFAHFHVRKPEQKAPIFGILLELFLYLKNQ